MGLLEEQLYCLIDASDGILKALQTLNERAKEIVERFGGDVKAEPVEPEPAKPKRWRYREGHEIVQDGDWSNSVKNPPGDWPPAAGWLKTQCIGMRVSHLSNLVRIACEVTDDANQCDQPCDAGEKVAEEPEHPAGPKPDPGEGYRILEKDPPEDLRYGDECQVSHRSSHWCDSFRALVNTQKGQAPNLWYRRKIEPVEPPQPPEPEYRELVLPADAGKQCEFSDDEKEWFRSELFGWRLAPHCWRCHSGRWWRHCRIRKDA